MGTMSIWPTVGHYYNAMCLVPIRAYTLEVVDQDIADLRLLEGSLGGAKIIGGITTWGYVCGQPRRLNLIRLLALSP